MAMVLFFGLPLLCWCLVKIPGLFKKEFSYSATKKLEAIPNLPRLIEEQLLLPFFISKHTKSEQVGPNLLQIRFAFLGKGKLYSYFTSQSKNGNFINAFLQGNHENFQISLTYINSELAYSLTYETEKSWKAGLIFYQWKGICAGFEAFMEELYEVLRRKSQTTEGNEIENHHAPSQALDLENETKENQQRNDELIDLETDNWQREQGAIVHEIQHIEPVFALPNSIESPQTAYFEIPVFDLNRAQWFYENVFGFEFYREDKPPYYLSHFKYPNGHFFGVLVYGQAYVPCNLADHVFIPVQLAAYAKQLIHEFGGKVIDDYQNIKGQTISNFIDIEGNTLAIIAL